MSAEAVIDLEKLPPLWVFDGHCGFCSASVQFVLERDRNGVVHFVSIQSPIGRRLALSQGIDPDDASSFLFIDRGRAFFASDAVVALARYLPWPWRALTALRILPKTWRDAAYGMLARNRYRIMGRRDACFIPTPEHRARFLDESETGL